MTAIAPLPIYDLAGQQTDPLAEEALAVIGTDEPERASVRPGDNRRHQQWLARSASGQGSRGWLTFAGPLTATYIALLKDRYETAMRVRFVPRHAVSVSVDVKQTAVNELAIRWTIVRTDRSLSEGSVTLTQGG